MTLPRLKLPLLKIPWRWRIYGGLPALTCGWRVMVVCFPATTEQATKIARRHGALAE